MIGYYFFYFLFGTFVVFITKSLLFFKLLIIFFIFYNVIRSFSLCTAHLQTTDVTLSTCPAKNQAGGGTS